MRTCPELRGLVTSYPIERSVALWCPGGGGPHRVVVPPCRTAIGAVQAEPYRSRPGRVRVSASLGCRPSLGRPLRVRYGLTACMAALAALATIAGSQGPSATGLERRAPRRLDDQGAVLGRQRPAGRPPTARLVARGLRRTPSAPDLCTARNEDIVLGALPHRRTAGPAASGKRSRGPSITEWSTTCRRHNGARKRR
jgi:hypothetical protein